MSISVLVPLWSVDQVQFISRNCINFFRGDPDILEKVSQIDIEMEQKWNKFPQNFLKCFDANLAWMSLFFRIYEQ